MFVNFDDTSRCFYAGIFIFINKEIFFIDRLVVSFVEIIIMDKKELLKDLEEAKKRLAYIEQQIKEIDNSSAEQFIIDCIGGCIIHKDADYPDSVFYMKDGKVWFEIAKPYLWVRYDPVWKVLSEQHGLSYADIQSLIKKVVEQHFNWQGLTPTLPISPDTREVEQHFNWHGLTPMRSRIPKCH